MSKIVQFNKALATTILNRMKDGETVKAILADEGMPTNTTWLSWINGENGAPSSWEGDHARARQLQADAFAADIITLADGVDDAALITAQQAVDALPEDATATEKRRAFFYAKKRSIEGAKLSIDARKWSASRMRPSRWGDKVTLEHSVDPAATLKIDLTQLPTELLERILLLQAEVVETTASRSEVDVKQLTPGTEAVRPKPWESSGG